MRDNEDCRRKKKRGRNAPTIGQARRQIRTARIVPPNTL